MPAARVIPMLPCADIDEVAAFFGPLGFTVVHRQVRPNPYLALEGHGFDLHYYGLPDHDPASSHSTCGVVVDDTKVVWDLLTAGLRDAHGRVPIAGIPRITRPRPRKNADGHHGFSLVDPAGNWIRFMGRGVPDEPAEAVSRLGEALQNAVVLADSKGDVAQAHKILAGAVRRAPSGDPAMAEARSFLDELAERIGPTR